MADKRVRDENDNGVIRLDVDMGDGTFAERQVMADALTVPFFNGKQFRTFFEFNIAPAARVVVKVVVPVNIIIFGFDVDLISGSLRITSAAGGTEGGSFSIPLPALPINGMNDRPTPVPTPFVTLSSGGTLAGETTLDVQLQQVAAQGNQSSTGSIGSGTDFRGLAPGVYYLIFAASVAAAVGVFRLRWIER